MHPEASGPTKPKPSDRTMRYGSLGLQLLLTIGASAWLGHWVDQKLALRFPVFLLLLTFFSFGGAMYQLYRQLPR